MSSHNVTNIIISYTQPILLPSLFVSRGINFSLPFCYPKYDSCTDDFCLFPNISFSFVKVNNMNDLISINNVLSIRNIVIKSCEAKTLDIMFRFKNVRYVEVQRCRNLVTVSGLTQCVCLRKVIINNHHETYYNAYMNRQRVRLDISGLIECKSLRHVRLYYLDICVEDLVRCVGLRSLCISLCGVVDYSCFANHGSLRVIHVRYECVSNLRGFDVCGVRIVSFENCRGRCDKFNSNTCVVVYGDGDGDGDSGDYVKADNLVLIRLVSEPSFHVVVRGMTRRCALRNSVVRDLTVGMRVIWCDSCTL